MRGARTSQETLRPVGAVVMRRFVVLSSSASRAASQLSVVISRTCNHHARLVSQLLCVECLALVLQSIWRQSKGGRKRSPSTAGITELAARL